MSRNLTTCIVAHTKVLGQYQQGQNFFHLVKSFHCNKHASTMFFLCVIVTFLVVHEGQCRHVQNQFFFVFFLQKMLSNYSVCLVVVVNDKIGRVKFHVSCALPFLCMIFLSSPPFLCDLFVIFPFLRDVVIFVRDVLICVILCWDMVVVSVMPVIYVSFSTSGFVLHVYCWCRSQLGICLCFVCIDVSLVLHWLTDGRQQEGC